jgi:putative flippase GtrA
MAKKDLKAGLVIGVAVGLLSQFILTNVVANPGYLLRFGALVGFTFLAPLALLVAYLIGKAIPVVYQFAKFAAVGALNTFMDVGILNLEIFLSGQATGLYYPVFKGISFLVATTNSFFWNKFWTFGSRNTKVSGEALKFYLFSAIGWVLNVGIATFIVNGLTKPSAVSVNIWANIGALCGVVVSLIWDFAAYKFFVFKQPTADAAETK